MGPMYRATVSVTQFMIPDEILWRIAVYWPDLGNHWHEASWRLHQVDDSRSASCLPDLIHSTYVLVMPGLLNEMAHRPHGLLEVTQGDMCHVRATVLPPKINVPILQEFLRAFCRRGWPMVRCVGTHRVPLTDELQDCHHGFFVQITITRAIPTHAVTRWCCESGQLMHLDYQYYAGDSHQFLVGVAHGLTLLASSLAPCWGIFGLVLTVPFGLKIFRPEEDIEKDIITSKPDILTGKRERMTEQNRRSRSSRPPKICPQTKEAGRAAGAKAGSQCCQGFNTRKALITTTAFANKEKRQKTLRLRNGSDTGKTKTLFRRSNRFFRLVVNGSLKKRIKIKVTMKATTSSRSSLPTMKRPKLIAKRKLKVVDALAHNAGDSYWPTPS